MRARLACAVAVLGAAAWLVAPGARGHSAIGGALDLDQRDVRVLDDFDPPVAGGGVLHPSFPGYDGVELAIWKASVEWGSELHGDGQGDPYQPGGLGSGGANFDASWQGAATGPGGANDNVHSSIPGDGGGVLAFCETPIGDGWRIRYYRGVAWDAGPAPPPAGRIDLQGVATHEYGHALGLGHSTTVGATMYASSNGTGIYQRSIAPDDVAGLQAIYGARSASKPRITSVEVAAGVATLRGTGFAAAGNQVWFTRGVASAPGVDPIVRVNAVAAAEGGTRIAVAVPLLAGPGDVLVRVPGSGHAALSNAWPFDPSGAPTTAGPPVVTSIAPASAPVVAAEPRVVLLQGTGFLGLIQARAGGVAVDPAHVTVHSDDALSLVLPDTNAIGPLAIELESAGGTSAPIGLELVAPEPPALALAGPHAFSATGLRPRIGAAPGTVFVLAGSTALAPSVMPGVLHADIGAGFQLLVMLGSGLVGAGGVVELSIPIRGLPYGTEVHLQAATLSSASPALPCVMTSVASATFYY